MMDMNFISLTGIVRSSSLLWSFGNNPHGKADDWVKNRLFDLKVGPATSKHLAPRGPANWFYRPCIPAFTREWKSVVFLR
jgi:hypothetical protein